MSVLIRGEPQKALTVGQELDLLRAVHARSGTSRHREGLCRLLMIEEAFGEVIDVLTTGEPLDYRGESILAHAYLSVETADANRLAHGAAERALALAERDDERSGALATRGKCETRLGDPDKALVTLATALALDPHNRDACKRVAALELAAQRPEAVVAFTGDLLAKGAHHARLFAAQSLAHAQAGDIAAAKKADGFDAFHIAEDLAPPPGWDTIAAFNAALATELLAHPGMRYERYGSASELTWRIENPARADTPLVKALLAQIIATIERHAVQVGQSDHPWAAAAPQSAFLRNWCVITESEGFETWHVHQFGWLSGVYYVRIPDSIADGDSKDGCLAFGLPDDLAGPEGAAAFGEHMVRPHGGLLMTFPSQCYHRTYPHRTKEKPICVAFDLRPDPPEPT